MASTIDLRGLVRPQLVEATKREDNPNVAEFRLQPLERGFGHTLGNAMRRMLLSSLRGAAVWGVRIDGVVHEHQTIPGVVEDVHQIIGNLKTLTLTLADDVENAVLHIKRDGAGAVTAGDVVPVSGVRVVNTSHHILTLQDDRDLSVRSVNSLKNSNIRSLGDLVRQTESQILQVKNFGKKSLQEIADLLEREGLNFGMRFEENGEGVRVLDWGTPPSQAAAAAPDDEEE